MGAYSPPECGEAIFQLALRTTLDPCNLIFDLIKGKDNNVNVPDSVISISSGLSVAFDNEPVVTDSTTFKIISSDLAIFGSNAMIADSTTFKIISDQLEVENKESVTFEDSNIIISSDELGVEILPAPKIEESNILVSSDDSPIKLWPSVETIDSIIAILADPQSSIRNPQACDLPTNINTSDEGGDGARQVWRGFIDKKDQLIQIGWDKDEDVRSVQQLIYSTQKIVDEGPFIPWKDYEHYQSLRQMYWQEYSNHLELYTLIPWGVFELPDPVNPDARHTWSIPVQIPWGSMYSTDLFERIPWYYPPEKDIEHKIPWNDFNHFDLDYTFPWYNPGPVDPTVIIPWGPVDWSDICCQKYWPPKACTHLVFVMEEPSIPGVCKDIVFSIGPSYSSHLGQFCPYQHSHSGRRDPFDPDTKLDVDLLKTKDEYDMNNVVSVHLIKGTLEPIEVTSISIRTDKQSYLWSFSLTIGKDDFSENFLEQLKPQWDGDKWVYPDLLIMVNFNYWVCTVESYQESRTFGKDTWQISGRSPSMLLGNPVCKKFDYMYRNPYDENAPTSGAQIINEVLEGVSVGINDTGWRANFDRYEESNPKRTSFGFDPSSADDWGFYPKMLTFQDSTQIDIVSSLVNSIGAFIITDPCPYKTIQERDNNTKNLFIRPHYGFPPWHWKQQSTNWFAIWGTDEHKLSGVKMLHTDLALDIGRSNELKSEYNAVMVMGTLNVGSGLPVVDMYRKGFEGARVYAPDVTDEKLQTARACAEMGRKILCETGFWVKHTLKMYSLAAPSGTPGFRPDEPELPGLCWPGDFVQVQERQGRRDSRVWYGDVEAVQIDVAINNNAVYVAQTLGINEYADR